MRRAKGATGECHSKMTLPSRPATAHSISFRSVLSQQLFPADNECGPQNAFLRLPVDRRLGNDGNEKKFENEQPIFVDENNEGVSCLRLKKYS